MKTIDLRHSSMDDEFVGDRGEDVDSQTIFEAERPATIDPVAEQTKTSPVKNLFFLIRKLVSHKQNFITSKNGPTVPLKPSPN